MQTSASPQHAGLTTHSFKTIVVGGGQAGLAMGHELAQLGQSFVILDAQASIGASWRNRWNSLRLFTSAAFDALPGLPFPAPSKSYPTKDEMADYLESYAAHFALPVHCNMRVDALSIQEDRYVLQVGEHRFTAENVIVAMSISQFPKIPPFASQLDPSIVQLHSSSYRNPGKLPERDTLVVGAGNSGAEIALELAQSWPTKRIWLAGRDLGPSPLKFDNPFSWWLFSHVFSVSTPLGRALQARKRAHGTPLGRLKPADLSAAGIERVPRVTGTYEGKPVLENGQRLDCALVIWCTGFGPGFDWIHLPVFGTDGYPIHERGIVKDMPGLFFLGLPFLSAFTSGFVGGVGRDAHFLAKHLATRAASHW
ncbi:portal protein [Ktedonosporobacter rubrisoli]|uniref:Portal protein n=2 Tax=Ktedonosporobacter rubrisoli TaxID=2509675 RepID=A0A4V0Z0M0_KTERU|nr:portal protein [Ktedonosporobacter rubrisoli]